MLCTAQLACLRRTLVSIVPDELHQQGSMINQYNQRTYDASSN